MRFIFLVLYFVYFSNAAKPTTGSTCPTYTPETRSLSGVVRDVWGCADRSISGTQDVHRSFGCGESLKAGQTGAAACKAKGFACATDFERWIGTDTGFVKPTLDTQLRVPVYNPGSHPSILNITQFNNWYLNDPFNIPIPVTMTISNADTCNSLIFSYSNDNFFPIDGLGFGNDWVDSNGVSRNFGFTFNYHGVFSFQGKENFKFTGDDDVFVFINDRLAIDLGGVHAAQSANIDLTYPSSGCPSNVPSGPCSKSGWTSTTPCACILGLKPGNTYSFDLFYNERHTVASDLAFSTTIIIQCPSYDWCGVCQGDGQSCCGSKCNDNNPCTNEKCDAKTGACIYSDVVCANPADKCKTSACAKSGLSAGTCVTTDISCVPANPDLCYNYGCDPSTGCYKTAKDCNDGDPCTIDTCDSLIGCKHTAMNCDDNNVCTTDQCSGGQCVHQSISCEQGNACTNNVCDPIAGCTYADTSSRCSTGNKCVTEGCNTLTGCWSTPINCNDNNACTIDDCNPTTGCTHSALSCDDGNKCTSDSCDSASGCQHQAVNCDDGNACTIDSCNPTTGCQHTPVICDDSNACTTDTCDSVLGCRFAALSCDDGQVCTTDTCDKVTGCAHALIPCDACTGVQCITTDPCKPNACDVNDSGKCKTKDYNCDDGNLCTIDTCDGSSGVPVCKHEAVSCTSADACHPSSCDATTGSCVVKPVTCNDGNQCTLDTCNTLTGHCQFNPIVCPYTDKCNPQECDGGQCVVKPVDCNDGNKCTIDRCAVEAGRAVCHHDPVKCDTSDACHPYMCDANTGLCALADFHCDTGNPCSTGQCVTNNGKPECKFTTMQCTSDKCVQASCNPLTVQCEVTNRVVCDDSNVCTEDRCDPKRGCLYIPINCDDNNACTIDSCDSVKGCVHTPVVCNDNNLCTNDFCDIYKGCEFTPVELPPSDKCTAVWCSPTLGISSTPTECPDACGGCDPETGCSDCPREGMTISKAASIGAGAITGIVLGAVAGAALLTYAGKKGYEKLAKSKVEQTTVNNNPMYENPEVVTENPMFE